MNTNFKMTAVKEEIFFCYEPCRRQLSLDHNFMLPFISLLNYIPKELPLFYKLYEHGTLALCLGFFNLVR